MQALRMWEWALVTAALVGLLLWIAPANVPVLVYKASLVTLGAVVGYWIDRRLFRGASYDRFLPGHGRIGDPRLASAAMIRRALIVAAVVLGMTMGL